MIKFYGYPKCSTCKKGENYLKGKNIEYEYINIKENVPSEKDLDRYVKLSNKDIKTFFNTSGLLYRELNLKDKLNDMTYSEKIKLLSSNGMLIKRPLFILDNKVLIGFKEKEWEEVLNEKYK